MKHFPVGQPTVRNRASVIHGSLQLTFLSKEQRNLFVNELLAEELEYNLVIETTVGDSLTPTQYSVSIDDVAWANNLSRIIEIAERYDYRGADEK